MYGPNDPIFDDFKGDCWKTMQWVPAIVTGLCVFARILSELGMTDRNDRSRSTNGNARIPSSNGRYGRW